MSKIYAFALLMLCSIGSYARVIKGTVIEEKVNTPLVGVVVNIAGTSIGAVTDIDGKYELTGVGDSSVTVVFTYMSFITERIVAANTGKNEQLLNVTLRPEAKELKVTEVKAKKLTHTEMAVINEIRASNNVVSGTSASQISKTMDRNAADVVKRIPGVSIQDDRFVVIRGLPDRYNTVWLNDAGAPSSEADKKSFSFDVIPSGLIDRVLISKTPSPELPGDFAGGMVKVYTTSIQDKNALSVNIQTSSRAGTTGENFKYNEPSKTDWLGYDDGGRNIPSIASQTIDKNDPTQNIKDISKAFGNDWIVKEKTASLDKRFAMSYTSVNKFKRFKLGNTIGITYTNTNVHNVVNRQDWDTTNERLYDYNDNIYINSASIGILENIGVSFGNNKIEFKNLYSQIGKSQTQLRNSGQDTLMNRERSYAFGYDSKATYSAQLGGTHTSKDTAQSRKYTWTIGYNDLFKNQPNLRRIKYTLDTRDSQYKAQVPSGTVDPNNGGGRYYSSLFEKSYSFNHNYSQKIHVKEKYSFTVNVGNYIDFKSRELTIRQLGYTISTINNGRRPDSLCKLPINEIFADANVGGPKDFQVGEGTSPSDRYNAKNELVASYISVLAPIGYNINVSGGVRYENNKQSLVGYVSTDTLKPVLKTNFLLPSVNVSYNINDKNLIRGAYGKTLNRPEFREFAPVVYYDFEDINLIKGSLYQSNTNKDGDSLDVAEIHNFDLRYEFYPSKGEMIHIGGFYKTISNAIQRVIDPGTSGDNKTITYINGSTAYCMGLELDIRKNLVSLDNLLKTNFFKDLTFVGNFALSKSESKIDTAVKRKQIPTSTLQGQSPYLVNLGLYYQNDKTGLRSSVLYNVFGSRLYANGTTEIAGESIGELPFQSLDVTFTKTLFKHYQLNIGVQNLLDSKVTFVKDIDNDGKFTNKSVDREYKSYKPGRYYTIGVKMNF